MICINAEALHLIDIAAGVGTFISALVAAVTIFEIKKQRESAYLPDLHIESYTTYLYDIPFLQGNRFFNYRYHNYNEGNGKELTPEEEENKKVILLIYKLQNLGFGVAKDIQVEWRFDIDKAFEMLTIVLPEDFTITRTKKYIEIANDEIDFHDYLYLDDLENKDHTDFILPVSIRENPKNATLPKLVSSFYSYFLVFSKELHKQTPKNYLYFDFKNFPMLYLHLNYNDIRNKRYSKSISIKFSIVSLTVEETLVNTKKLGLYHLTVSEK